MVAESMEIFGPISQLGWASACSGVAWAICSAVQVRKGPPEAVRIRRETCRAFAGSSTWKIAECSESTGITTPPASLAVRSSEGPAQTRLSLLARAITAPALAAESVGARPAKPTMADITHWASAAAASATVEAPAPTSIPVPDSRSRSSPSFDSSSITASFGRQRRACSARRSTLRPAVRAWTSTSAPALSSRSRVETPTDPVEPRTLMRRGRFNGPIPGGSPAGRRR